MARESAGLPSCRRLEDSSAFWIMATSPIHTRRCRGRVSPTSRARACARPPSRRPAAFPRRRRGPPRRRRGVFSFGFGAGGAATAAAAVTVFVHGLPAAQDGPHAPPFRRLSGRVSTSVTTSPTLQAFRLVVRVEFRRPLHDARVARVRDAPLDGDATVLSILSLTTTPTVVRRRLASRSGSHLTSLAPTRAEIAVAGWVTSRQIEAAASRSRRHMKRGGKLWIRIFPDKPVTKKPPRRAHGQGEGRRGMRWRS